MKWILTNIELNAEVSLRCLINRLNETRKGKQQ